jgi:hypothetical protein
METLPFCTRCGRVGPRLTGLHIDDDGLVRWTLYPCGHVTTELALDARVDPVAS